MAHPLYLTLIDAPATRHLPARTAPGPARGGVIYFRVTGGWPLLAIGVLSLIASRRAPQARTRRH
ncbi:hypothetical protein C1I98_00900 [Spongiactinospora gelatinilytica]|uniref:Uncharacterized protein n=1 Tax=Spongiactinospora gelatinilytica TaxID=2666298 RepID=A0A2W2IEU8_9ACTN|nr:hypothetical protein [Spongiactinospora gelatinilytica]PZG56637.1 hypothetical protein C1I98_00900 [Spongiactinospora gelatinilytica]